MKNKPQTIKTSIKHPLSSIKQPVTKLNGVLFDFDGVVLDSMKQHVKAWQHAFGQQGIHLTELDIYLMEGMGVKAVVQSVCDKYNLPEKHISKLMQIKSEYYKQHLKIRFYDGFFDLLNFLKNQNIKLVVVTGGDRSRIIPFAEKYLDGYFQGFVCSDDVQHTKPSPEPYLKGLEILGLQAKECIVIENAPLGIQAAKSAGIKTIAIETTLDKSYLEEADIVYTSFFEIKSKFEEILKK